MPQLSKGSFWLADVHVDLCSRNQIRVVSWVLMSPILNRFQRLFVVGLHLVPHSSLDKSIPLQGALTMAV